MTLPPPLLKQRVGEGDWIFEEALGICSVQTFEFDSGASNASANLGSSAKAPPGH